MKTPPIDYKPPSPPVDRKPPSPVKPEKPTPSTPVEPPPVPRKPPALSEPQKSTFVTVVSWIFIVLSGFSCCIFLFQSIVYFTMMPNIEQQMMNNPQLGEMMKDPKFSENAPQMGQMMFSFMRYIFIGLFIASSITLFSSIGLLKRKNWARIIFIIFLSLGLAFNCLTILQQLGTAMMLGRAEGGVQTFGLAIVFFSIGIASGFSILFGWIIKELVSAKIKAEFVGQISGISNYQSKKIHGSAPGKSKNIYGTSEDEIISEKVTKWAYYIPAFVALIAILWIPMNLLDARFLIRFASGFVLTFVCMNIVSYMLRYKPKYEFPGGGIIYKGVFQDIKVSWSDIKMLKKRKTGMYGFWEVTCDEKKLGFNIYKNHPNASELEELIIEKGIPVDA